MEDEGTEREEEEGVRDAEHEEDEGAWAVEEAFKDKRAVGVGKGNVWLIKGDVGRGVASGHIWKRKRQIEIVEITSVAAHDRIGSC